MPKRNPLAGIQPGTWLHRTESAKAKDGGRLTNGESLNSPSLMLSIGTQ